MCAKWVARELDPFLIGPFQVVNVVCFRVDRWAPDLKFIDAAFYHVPTMNLALESFEQFLPQFLDIIKKFCKESVIAIYCADVFADVTDIFGSPYFSVFAQSNSCRATGSNW